MVYSNCRLHPVHMYGRLSVDPLRLRFHTCTLKEISCVIRPDDFGTWYLAPKDAARGPTFIEYLLEEL